MIGKSQSSKGDSKPSPPTEEISGYFGKETVFEGKMTFEGVFRMEGRFEGEIFESGTLIVGESAVVKGKIGANIIIVNGQIEGEVIAKERVEIHATGQFHGNLITPILTISEGGFFDGNCKMEKRTEKEEEPHLISPQIDRPLSA